MKRIRFENDSKGLKMVKTTKSGLINYWVILSDPLILKSQTTIYELEIDQFQTKGTLSEIAKDIEKNTSLNFVAKNKLLGSLELYFKTLENEKVYEKLNKVLTELVSDDIIEDVDQKLILDRFEELLGVD